MKLNRRALMLGAGLAGAGLAGCARTDGHRTVIGLTYIPNIQFCAFYHAVDAGLFAKAGVDVELRHHGAQEGLFTALEAGEEQVVFASVDEAVLAAAAGLGTLRVFASCYRTYPGHVLGGPAVRDLTDLKGRRLGVPGRYGASWLTALAALHRAELSQDEVEIVEIGWTQVAALTSGKVDAAIGFINNEAVQLEQLGFGAAVLDAVDPLAPDLLGPGLMTLAQQVEGTTLARIVEAVVEAEQQIIADPTKGIEAALSRIPTLAEPEQRAAAEGVLAATIKLWDEGSGVDLGVPAETLQRTEAFLHRVGAIEQVPGDLLLQVP
ncbi:ABC transporter substrate-binding protein [Arachnia propionica]|uniref:ABC transporter substrate-binding protein n=1 Tax=Arachnia propionica TaxID=1750 RepID=A0A3P1T2B4_9ACTN|nr:ABC transporter substrate-binding protein [Arachnia propionica]RRD03504.1 ABC transporter substrate-binding protein [Arachnia propionica]